MMEKNVTVTTCTDADKVYDFLLRIDKTLPVPLSERVNVAKFASRAVERSIVFAIEDQNQLAAAALFYYNFQKMSFAYLDLLATAPGYGGRGYASLLMNAIEDAARKAGMTEFHLHTNDTNHAAVALYTKRGYEVISTEHKLQMRKVL